MYIYIRKMLVMSDEALAIRAIIWQEGRELMASQPESLELAFELLRCKFDNKVKLDARGEHAWRRIACSRSQLSSMRQGRDEPR
jgi:hypothetical protein